MWPEQTDRGVKSAEAKACHSSVLQRTHIHTTHTHRGSFPQVLLEHSHQTNLDIRTFVSCSFSAAEIAAVHGQARKKEHTCALRHGNIDVGIRIRTCALTEKHILSFVVQSVTAHSCPESKTVIVTRLGKQGCHRDQRSTSGTRASLWIVLSRDCSWCWLTFRVFLPCFI